MIAGLDTVNCSELRPQNAVVTESSGGGRKNFVTTPNAPARNGPRSVLHPQEKGQKEKACRHHLKLKQK